MRHGGTHVAPIGVPDGQSVATAVVEPHGITDSQTICVAQREPFAFAVAISDHESVREPIRIAHCLAFGVTYACPVNETLTNAIDKPDGQPVDVG